MVLFAMLAAMGLLTPASATVYTMIEGATLPIKPSVLKVQSLLNVAPMAAALPSGGVAVDRTKWSATCDSQQSPYVCNNVFDKDNTTFWQSGSTAWPHTLTIDMKKNYIINGLAMLPSNTTDGNIATHEVYTSLNGKNWGLPVAYGTWWGDATQKLANFQPLKARYVRLVSKSAAQGEGYLKIADFNVYYQTTQPQAFSASMGRWSATIDMPLVPAGGWVDPLTGKVITYSSYAYDRFDDGIHVPPDQEGRTLTASYDPATGLVTQRLVTETGHDMFCPGMSFDANGRMVITGGRTNTRTSIYESDNQGWTRYADMQEPRGYQSSATLPDGRIFTIGGSWETVNASCIPKNGEIYDPAADTWTLLPQTLVTPMLTQEMAVYNSCDTFRSDNHGWLIPWKNNTIFQAGPSKTTHWYTMSSDGGGIADAGPRADDDDAMCGFAVMYDATKGSILTAGGSIYYANKPASPRAYLATLDDTNLNSTVTFTPTGSMANPRIYHNAMVLPNGEILVIGGRSVGAIFADGPKAIYIPEIYSPVTGTWRIMANTSIPRNYHSFAILLPDATIFSAGGGLCPGDCKVNHFDAQIFTPPYLLTSTGALAPRPVISSLSSSTLNVGDTLTISTTGPIAAVSLIRYGSATHAINTDQRRIALTPVASASGASNAYDVVIPDEDGVVIPGYWMVFVLDSNGVPSKAATVMLKV